MKHNVRNAKGRFTPSGKSTKHPVVAMNPRARDAWERAAELEEMRETFLRHLEAPGEGSGSRPSGIVSIDEVETSELHSSRAEEEGQLDDYPTLVGVIAAATVAFSILAWVGVYMAT